MDDLISRRAAVSRMSDLLMLELKGERLPSWNEVYSAMQDLPSAQPKTCEFWDSESSFCTLNRPSAQPVNYGSTKEDDLINRRDVIDAINERIKQIGYDDNPNPLILSIRQAVREVPFAQPKQGKLSGWICPVCGREDYRRLQVFVLAITEKDGK